MARGIFRDVLALAVGVRRGFVEDLRAVLAGVRAVGVGVLDADRDVVSQA